VLPSTEMIYTLGKMKYNGLWAFSCTGVMAQLYSLCFFFSFSPLYLPDNLQIICASSEMLRHA
jgi:hypothetical protein